MTENSYLYSREEMPHTTGGRRVQHIEGEPSSITTRASQIEQLGEKMGRAARTLELFADGTIGKGESFDAIREQAKEVYEDLRVAAQRYMPSGTALGTYASALGAVQSSTGWRVDGAERTWPEVRDAARSLSSAQSEQSQYDFDANHDVEQTGSRPTTGVEQSSFDSAVDTWEMYWSGYDAPVETWESAYESACSSLEGTNANGVRDGFWDNAMPFVEAMLTVLFYVGIALMIVAFFVTGPLALLAGILAAVVGVLSLLGEISKMAAGRGDWTSVALAAIGVIPFGKLAKLASVADFAAVGSSFPRLSGSFRLAFSEFVEYGTALDRFVGTKMPTLFNTVDDFGNIIARSPHGLNSQNLFRGLLTPQFLAQGNGWTGGIRQGWQALAGNPTNLLEGIGGSIDVYVDMISTLREGAQRLAPAG